MIEGLTVKTVVLTPEAAEDIRQTAADAGYTYGIGYWAEWHATERNKIREHNDAQHPRDRGPWIELTDDALARGCALALTAGTPLKDLDGSLADIIIQYAVLGEQKYD